MNANWIVNMLLRRLIGRGMRLGVDAGLRWLARRSGAQSGNKRDAGQGASKPVQTKAGKEADRARIRALRQARRGMRGPKV
ncbi:hypothetical protein [Cribrihabitans pelagius]|uniref:hypothetical protein n=1 Tax=Cribrihabitans pelagius TaxID=1765746 RepID=UPI003B596AA5